MSNVVGIQHDNLQNPYNGLNFQQAFTTSGFGFQQQGSLFNHQAHFPSSNQSPYPNNHNFQLSSLFMPFFNQHNNNPNQPQTFPSFGSLIHAQLPVTVPQSISSTTVETTDTTQHVSESPVPQSTVEPTVNVETTPDPTLSFDIRLEKDKNMETSDSEIQNTTRRNIEGLPTSDEENDEGPLGERIGTQLLKTLVG